MTRSICVDAGPVVRFVAFPDESIVQDIWNQWEDEGAEIFAPALLFYEVTNALYRYQKHKLLNSRIIQQALEFAYTLPITLIEDAELHRSAVSIATRYGLTTTYDAHYLALAGRTGAELWTMDKRLYNLMSSAGDIRVRLIGEP